LKSLYDTPEKHRKDYYKIFMANKKGEPKNDYPGMIHHFNTELIIFVPKYEA